MTLRLRFLMIALLIGLSACKMVWRSVRYNVPSVTDYKLWEERPIRTSGNTTPLQDFTQIGIPPASEWAVGKHYKDGMSTEQYFRKTGTVAFLVLRGDSLLYEYYSKDFDRTSRFNCFSMSKVYVSTLLGIAVDEGYITSIDQSIGDYLPWCTDSARCAIKIRHLLQMTSGIRSNESYLNPWATSTKLYYGDQVEELMRGVELNKTPGKSFFYQNTNSQLLGMIIAEATGRPLAQYLEEKIWKPIGMESDAGWSLHEGTDIEKAFCCLNARARDFARFGLLFLNGGVWNGEEIVSLDWISQVTSLDTLEGARQRYQYNWYTTAEQEDFYGQGLLGQFTYICPSKRTVIIRLGNSLDYRVPWYDNFKHLTGIAEKPYPVKLRKRDLRDFAGTYVFGESIWGDSVLAGRKAEVSVTGKGLKVKTNFNKTWIGTPSSDSTFYNIRYGRRLVFHRDGDGKVTGMRWTRRGNSWEVHKKE